MDRPQLYGTPLSHFTRKIRILLAELGVDYDLVRPTNLLGSEISTYGENPLLRVPTLVYRGETVIDSDHIARYLVLHHDPLDHLGVRSEDARSLNQLAVANGIMANEVVIILARRGGLTDTDQVAYFRKLGAAIERGLTWLEGHCDPDEVSFRYTDIALISMWQHVEHYASAPDLGRYPRIAARVQRFAGRASVAETTPAASLLAATAAEPKPG